MKRILIYIFIIFTAYSFADSQSLRIERSDVGTSRAGHVTANYTFGLDIYIDELENVNSASFQLRWNFGDFIHFSGYKIGDFGDNGTVFITDPKFIQGTSNKFMNVGVFSGTTVGENEFDSPFLIHLEFTVSYNAPNREALVFDFINLFATAFVDGSQQNLEIESEAHELDIHGFINVYPGDANNDGLVDTRDYNQIGLYFTGNSIDNSSRSFKRENASIMWTGQKVLVWDNADATFADCDGDGVITVADGMVVFHNDSKTHEEGTGLSEDDDEESDLKGPLNSGNIKKIPVYAGFSEKYRAITTHTEIPEDVEVLDVEKGELFNGTYAPVIHNVKDNRVEFTVGSFDKSFAIEKSGIVAYIVVENDPKAEIYDHLRTENSTVLLQSGSLSEMQGATGVITSDSKNITVKESINDFEIISKNAVNGYNLFDFNGRILESSDKISNRIIIEKTYPSGNYILQINSETPHSIILNITK